MSFVMQNDLARDAKRRPARAPIATVFGAGIAGLSVAHELIERGFTVQVVEAFEDFDDEYACLVGGMAANQYGRIPAEIEDLHPYLFKPQRTGNDRADQSEDGAPGVRVWLETSSPSPARDLHVSVAGSARLRVPYVGGEAPPALLARLTSAILTLPGVHAAAHPSEANTLVVTSSVPAERPEVLVEEELAPGRFEPSAYVRVESTAGIAPLRACSMQRVQQRVALAQRIQLDRSVVPNTPSPWIPLTDEHGFDNGQKLDAIVRQLQRAWALNQAAFARLRDEQVGDPPAAKDFWLSARMQRREVLLVEVRGHTDRDGEEGANRALSLAWAELVKAELVLRNGLLLDPIPDLAQRLVAVGLGSAEPIGNQHRASGRRRDNRVELRIVENRIPGEHGYRYFPGFYWHLFDTMKRTPILDRDGQETGATAYDQLVPTETIDLALAKGRAPETIPVERPRSLEALRKLVRLHLDPDRLGVSERDLLRFQLKLLKFLTGCPARRTEWEKQTWWEFLDGDGYSEPMRRILMDTPEALIAMNALETDAHSQGLIYVHILMESLGSGEPANRTLNGPTTDAWLRHWKRYLKRQGVRFFIGRLDSLHFDPATNQLLPDVTTHSAYSAEAQLVVNPTPDGVYKVILNRLVVSVNSAAAGGAALAADVAAAINAAGDACVTAAPTGRGVVRLFPAVRRGSLLLRVAQPDAPPPDQLWLNGLNLAVTGAHSTANLRDTLVGALQAHIDDGGLPLRVRAHGARSFELEPREAAIVSLMSAAPGEVGLEIGGLEVSVRNDRVFPLARWDDALEILRDALRARLVDLGYVARPLGTTGISIHGPEAASVSPGGFGGRLQLGPDLRPELVLPPGTLEAIPPGVVSMFTFPPSTSVLGPIPEEPEHEYVSVESGSGLPAPGAGPDFYFLAVPYLEASRLVDAVSADVDGCLKQLVDFNGRTGVAFANGELVPVDRDGHGRPLDPPGGKYALRELSGVQYYFNNHIRIGRGHTYYLGSPWGLSSISQLAYWRDRPSERSAFLGQLSVDIGSFYAPSGAEGVRRSAWNSGRQEIAEEVWAQLVRWADREFKPGTRYRDVVPSPGYYHLDRNLLFDVAPPRRYAGALEIVLTDIAAPRVYKLTVGRWTATSGSTNDPQDVADALEAAGGVAIRVSANRLVAATPIEKATRVRIVISQPKVATRYALRVGGAPLIAYAAAAAASPASIRAPLVAKINASVPGALALAEPDADPAVPSAPAAFTIQLAEGTSVTGLACTLGAEDVEHFLALDPPGQARASVDAGLAIENEPAVQYNLTPFMINPAGIWHLRPGLDPNATRRTGEYEHPWPNPIWYTPTLRRWLMVGNHMATFTRISTMESANESARHAVLRALHELALSARGTGGDYNNGGFLFGSMPDLWDPAEREPDEAAALKRIDEKLCAQSTPHPLEILRIEEWVDGLPEDLVREKFPEHLETLLQGIRYQLRDDWKATERDELVASVATIIGQLLKGV